MRVYVHWYGPPNSDTIPDGHQAEHELHSVLYADAE
jgi:hypothetical protein